MLATTKFQRFPIQIELWLFVLYISFEDVLLLDADDECTEELVLFLNIPYLKEWINTVARFLEELPIHSFSQCLPQLT